MLALRRKLPIPILLVTMLSMAQLPNVALGQPPVFEPQAELPSEPDASDAVAPQGDSPTTPKSDAAVESPTAPANAPANGAAAKIAPPTPATVRPQAYTLTPVPTPPQKSIWRKTNSNPAAKTEQKPNSKSSNGPNRVAGPRAEPPRFTVTLSQQPSEPTKVVAPLGIATQSHVEGIPGVGFTVPSAPATTVTAFNGIDATAGTGERIQTAQIVPTPGPALFSVPQDDPIAPSIVTPPASTVDQGYQLQVENWSPLARFVGITPTQSGEQGIGHERVQFAPFEIDVSQPSNYWLVRVDAASGLQTPDRAAFFWSRSVAPSPNAQAQNSVNYQDLRLINETGTDAFSVMTEIPVRAVDYTTTGGSGGGLGDMKVATKTRLINGNEWQVTQIFRTYIPTGNQSIGTGTGHVSLEPGLLARYQLSDATYFHGEAKLWFPVGADPLVAGQVLTYGVGVSHVFYETDTFGFIPTMEMVNYQFLGGHKTVQTDVVSSLGETAVNVLPGARFVFGPPGDLGLFELGVSGMFGVGNNRYLDNMLRVDFKFIY